MDVVRLGTRTSGGGGRSATLGVPKAIADELRAANIDTFSIELTEEGILFRPVDGDSSGVERPSWLKPRAAPGRRAGNGSGR